MRCVNEAALYEQNCFITLTYDDEHLPKNGSLDVREFQLFMKKFRKKCGKGIRFYHCGEYGSKHGRPHYHAIIFNYDFSDKVLFTIRNGIKLYTSDTLRNLWSKGFVTIGDVTFDSAAYVARYIMKKINGEEADLYYTVFNADTGEEFKLMPEYTTMSRGGNGGLGGIGKAWFDKYYRDVYKRDAMVINAKEVRPPKFYDTLFESVDGKKFAKLKNKRVRRAKDFKANNTDRRLKVRETVKQARISLLKRGLEDET